MSHLTSAEQSFTAHYGYESGFLGTDHPIPAHAYLKELGLKEHEIFNIIWIWDKERLTLCPEEPKVPFELPWKTRQEAINRNAELAEIAEALERKIRLVAVEEPHDPEVH